MVGRACCVESCRSRTDGGAGNSGYFRLPAFSKRKLRQSYVNALGLADYFMNDKVQKLFFVCFRHFTADQFNTSGKILKLKKGKIL